MTAKPMLLGYTRCSTAEQVEGSSLQEQERTIRGYAMYKGVTAYDLQIYTDAGVSGSIHLQWRRAGRDLLETVKPGDTVIASKLDRMFRNSLDALKTFTDFKQRGIHLVLFDLGVEPITNDTGMSKLIFQVMSAFADHERERIRERMLEGKRAKQQRGGHAGGEAPYGFRIVGEKREARLEPVEAEQQVIKRVVELRGKSPYFIARELKNEGICTRTNRPFHYTQVARILARNPNAVQ